MKVLYHHRTQGTGAEGVHIAHVIKELRYLGHSVDVVSPTGQDPTLSAGDNPYRGRKGIKNRALHAFSRSAPQWLFEAAELLYNAVALVKLRAVASQGPELLYERHAFFMAAGALLASRTKTPYIVEVNEVAGEKRVRELVLVEPAKRIERFVFNKASAIIVVSEFLKSKIAALGVPEEKIFVVPNGVDERVFHPGVERDAVRRALGIAPDALVFGFIGWFVAWHNLELLLEAFARVARGKNMRLMLVGDGVLKSELEARAARLGVSEQMVFPGAVPHPDVPKHLNAMDVCVIPGSNAYRSPIKLFEYMVMQKAVVAPSHPPITQVMQHEREGLVFAPDDLESLTECLRRVAEEPELRQRLGQSARAKILEQHLWRHSTERVLEIYQQLRARR